VYKVNHLQMPGRGTITPFGLSKEERATFHALLDKLTRAIWQKVEEPAPRPRPELRLVKGGVPPALPALFEPLDERSWS